MCVLKDPGAAAAAAAGLLTRADRWQSAEHGRGELSDSRCSVILRCGSVCAYEYASTISLAFGRSSSYCSAGRKERVARSKHAPSLTYSKSQESKHLQSARGAGQAAKSPSHWELKLTARLDTGGSVLLLLPSVSLHLCTVYVGLSRNRTSDISFCYLVVPLPSSSIHQLSRCS
jgi:hypothetical protein